MILMVFGAVFEHLKDMNPKWSTAGWRHLACLLLFSEEVFTKSFYILRDFCASSESCPIGNKAWATISGPWIKILCTECHKIKIIKINRGSRVIFNNAPAHTSAVVVAKLMELGFQLVSHPPYSPDLAPSDYYLFPNMKKWLAGKRFYGNEDVIAETNPPRLPRFKWMPNTNK